MACALLAQQSATGKMASIWTHNFHFAAINLRGRERERERDVPHSLGFAVRGPPTCSRRYTLPPAARGEERGRGGRREGQILRPADGIFTCSSSQQVNRLLFIIRISCCLVHKFAPRTGFQILNHFLPRRLLLGRTTVALRRKESLNENISWQYADSLF